MEKENKSLKILLIIFIIISLALGGFILYDKVLKKEESIPPKPVKNNSNTNEINNDENTLPEWVEYLLNQNITGMGYGTWDADTDKEGFRDISKSQLKGYLQKLTSE